MECDEGGERVGGEGSDPAGEEGQDVIIDGQ